MKKITLLALACAALLAAPAVDAQEVTYVEDPAQGYLFNRMKDNWFIEAEGGAGVMFSKWDHKADFSDRIGGKVDLGFGKWFSPLLGLRVGGEWQQLKGASIGLDGVGIRSNWYVEPGVYYQKWNQFGAYGDVLFNATNWICGYKPARFYNAVLYVGASANWNVCREDGTENTDWKYKGHNRSFHIRGGLLNQFAVSKHVNLMLDLRFDEMQEVCDGYGNKSWNEIPSVLLGVQYKFNNTEWSAPVVPVCPEVKYSDAYVDDLKAKLEAANQNIARLKQELDECRNKKAPVVKEQPKAVEGPLATIYYPINKSYITDTQKEVVNAVAEVMQNEKDKSYLLTGWADNYTGNSTINTRLRKERVAGVKKALVAKGVAANRLETQINDGELTNYGAKAASLDRAVTINRK